ncbi:hypothetical protein, partial [Variovorax defluvii]|uniref:hypothetical protein n=1 Tax=Variovorax defluvii TaxID=913761 RepID=UPI0031F186A4
FFGYFLWRDKESNSPAGANSRLLRQTPNKAKTKTRVANPSLPTNNKNSAKTKAQSPHPLP